MQRNLIPRVYLKWEPTKSGIREYRKRQCWTKISLKSKEVQLIHLQQNQDLFRLTGLSGQTSSKQDIVILGKIWWRLHPFLCYVMPLVHLLLMSLLTSFHPSARKQNLSIKLSYSFLGFLYTMNLKDFTLAKFPNSVICFFSLILTFNKRFNN